MQYAVKGIYPLSRVRGPSADRQFPVKEVDEYRQQLLDIKAELDGSDPSHEGRTAEDAYAERLAELQIDGSVPEGDKVVMGLLGKCLLWVEIMQEK